jgi:hypothetical protein
MGRIYIPTQLLEKEKKEIVCGVGVRATGKRYFGNRKYGRRLNLEHHI